MIVCPGCAAPLGREPDDETLSAAMRHVVERHNVGATTAPFMARRIVHEALTPGDRYALGMTETPPATPAAPVPVVTPPPPHEEAHEMARPCGNCNKVGHGRKDCPDLLEAKAVARKMRPAAIRKRGAGKRRPAAPAPAARNGHAPIADNLTKKSGREFLAHLEGLRDELTAKIAVVRELVEIL